MRPVPPDAAAPLLEIRSLAKSFAGFKAIDGVSFSVPHGSISAIIGPNGAGKTTLFNLITGHLHPDAGTITFSSREVTRMPPHRLCRLGMGRSFQRTNVFGRLSAYENVQAAYIAHRGDGRRGFVSAAGLYRDETESLLKAVGLHDRARSAANSLSHGDQKQLELGIALAIEPTLLLLDEPTAGMSAGETGASTALIQRIARERGLTLLFTEHDMEVVFSISDRIIVLHQGRVLADGPPHSIRANPEVRSVYLGERIR
jgi:branched-chain amino acid transport system ATP-binding protein